MELDARSLEGGGRLETDVCIIGAGPAGLTLGRQLAGSRASVVVLESGGTESDDDLQRLNEGATFGSPYAGLRATRHRQVAGAAHLWNTRIDGAAGAKYVPLDAIDFEERDGLPHGGWPFARDELEPFYQRAHAVCGLRACDYEAAHWVSSGRPCLPTGAGGELTSRVYQLGRADRFTVTHRDELRAAENVRLLHHATCCALHADGTHRVTTAAVRTSTQGTLYVAARFFVLAAGAVENARLLLASGWGGWVGRCFMEHPRDYALTLTPRSPDVFHEIGFCDLHRSRDDAWIIGRLALTESVLRAHGFPNASVTLLPRTRRRPLRDALDGALGRVGIPAFRRPTTTGYGWSATDDVVERCDALQVLMNLEQRPHPDNRVALSSARDPFGVPRAELHWRWRGEEQAELNRLRAFVADRLHATGLGSVHVASGMLPDPNAHHHAGTTRISPDARAGVVDADCRVHGTDNLYVAGSSVFPTAGFANPTLTIVALAVRLGDHLGERL